MSRLLISALIGIALSACATGRDADTSGQALTRDSLAAECDRRARAASETARGPVINGARTGTPGSEVAAQVERDVRWRLYQECLEGRR